LVTRPLPGRYPRGVAADRRAVWVANRDSIVSRIDPVSNTVVATISVGAEPGGVAVDAHAVWVANADSGTVSRIDPVSSRVVATITVGAEPSGLAADARAVCVANREDDTVTYLDPAGNSVGATIKVGDEPIAERQRGGVGARRAPVCLHRAASRARWPRSAHDLRR